LEKNQKAKWEMKIVPGANHKMLVNAPDYNSLYADVPPGFFDVLAQWVRQSTEPAN
jgi:hypothetical protein